MRAVLAAVAITAVVTGAIAVPITMLVERSRGEPRQEREHHAAIPADEPLVTDDLRTCRLRLASAQADDDRRGHELAGLEVCLTHAPDLRGAQDCVAKNVPGMSIGQVPADFGKERK